MGREGLEEVRLWCGLYLFCFDCSLLLLFGGWSRVGGEDVEGGRELLGGVLRVEVGVAWCVVGDFLRGGK